MALRLALLMTVCSIGCNAALPDSSQSKGTGAGAEAVAGSKTNDKGSPETTGDAKEAANSDKEKGEGKASEEEIQGHVTVRCVPAEKRALTVTVDSLGRTELPPQNLGSLTATVEGHVHRLLVNVGDVVAANQPVVELDTTVARTALDEKLATLESLKAALRLLESRPRTEETRAAELAVEQGKLAVEHAQSVVERLRPLAGRQEVSPQQFADAEQSLKLAGLQRDTAEAQLKVLTLGPRPEAIAEARTKIAIAEQAVANGRATLDLHTLRAPIAGSVESLNCHLGQTLTVGTPVGEVVNRRRLLVTAYLPARSIRCVEPGMSARIDVVDGENRDASAGQSDEINGQVAFVGSVADPQTGNFPTRILVDNAEGRLRVGQVVKATIKLRTEPAAIVVPQAAIFDEGEGPLLAVVRDGKIKQLHPEVGTAEGGMVVVRKTDLHDEDMVVTEGAYNVKDGTDATIAPVAAAVSAKGTKTAKGGGTAKAGEHE